MSKSTTRPALPAGAICLKCGLCCNGVIFADVKLVAGEKPAQLQSLGLRLSPSEHSSKADFRGNIARQQWHLPQPCAAFDGCRCRIYSLRPSYCRQFECLLLKDLQQGKVTRLGALRVIRSALRQVEQVRRLLDCLGDREESLPLAARFRRMTRRLTRCEVQGATAELYGQLTLAFHKLRLTLDKAFYPAPSEDSED